MLNGSIFIICAAHGLSTAGWLACAYKIQVKSVKPFERVGIKMELDARSPAIDVNGGSLKKEIVMRGQN